MSTSIYSRVGDVTDIGQVRAEKEIVDLMQYKYICANCGGGVFMIYNGVAQCVVCDDLIKLETFTLGDNDDETGPST